MAIISEKSFVNGVLKNQSKKTQHPQTAIVNEADFLSRGADEMSRRKTAYENYKKAVEEQRQIWQKSQERRATQAYAARADARQDMAAAYGQAGAGTAAKRTAYENYTYALKQQELWQKKLRGGTLTPAEEMILNRNVYKSPERAQAAEDNRYKNQAVTKAEQSAVTQQEFNRSPAMQGQYGTYKDYKQSLYDQTEVDLLKGREDELDTQIKELEQEIRTRQEEANNVTTEEGERRQAERNEAVRRGEAESVQDMERRLGQLKEEQTQLMGQRSQKRSHMAIDPLDEKTKALLREYNAGGMYRREYAKQNGGNGLSKVDARADLRAMGYTEDEIKSLAEYEQRLYDYRNAVTQAESTAQFGREHPVIASVASALMAPFKAAGNVESARGVLPKGLGGYQNEDMPTNIYSPWYGASRASGSIRGAVMQNMSAPGQFIYEAGMSALDSAVNIGVSIGLVGAAGLGTGAAAQNAVASTMNFVMGSEVAADSVYEGIQNGKSNVDALIDGIVEGAIEGITEKYSVGDIIETMLSGKAAWRKIVRAFASEGAEEVASNWLNRVYDVVVKRDRSEVDAAYAGYLAQGMSEREALAAMVKDFAEEDGLSFLAGGLSGWAMSGTYAALGRGATEANIQKTAAQAIARGEVQDVVDLGLAQGENTKAYERAQQVQQTMDAGAEPTQKEVAGVLREYANEQRDAAEESDRAYQNYKKASEEVEQAVAEWESIGRQSAQAQQGQQTQQNQGVDLYDENGSLLDVGDGWAEIDPERYAGQQDAEAEAEMNAASAAADAEYLEAQVKKNGYDELTAAYFVNGNTEDLSVEEYARKFQKAYERGGLGVSKEWTVSAAAGMNRDVAAAAWDAGRKAAQQSGDNTGKYSINDTRNLSQKEQFKEYRAGRFKAKDEFAFGTAPESVQKIGLTGEIVMSQTDYKKARTAKHNVPQRVFNNLNSIMDSAVLSFEKGDEVGVLTAEIDADGKPLLLAFRKNVNLDGETVTRMKSAYGLDTPAAWVQNQIGEGKTLRILDNKKADNFLNSVGYKAERTENYQLGDTVSEILKNVKGGNEHGSNVSGEGQKRDAGARAGEQDQRVGKAAGERAERTGRRADRAAAARALSEVWPGVTNRELLGEAGSEGSVRVMPEEEIAKNEDAKRAADFFRTAGIKNYKFVVGQLEITENGKLFRADGATLADGTVIVRLDSEQYSAFQLAKHEGYHQAAAKNAALAQKITKRLLREGKISQEMIDSYIGAYNGIYGDNAEAYAEEIVADAYAGINRTAYGTNAIRAEVTMEVGQWTKKTGSARAPPEKSRYSIEKTTENQPFVEVEQDILDGVPENEWVSAVKENLKKKFPNGITVGNNEISIDKQSRREMTFSRYMQWLYHNDPQTRADKLRATDNADEILRAATGWVNEGLNHPRTDNIRDFARGNVLLRVGGNDYAAEVVVGTRVNGEMILYDVLNMQPASFEKREADAAKTVNPSPGVGRNTASVSENSINKDGGKVKVKFASGQQRFRDVMKSERAAEYLARTENALVRRLADNLSVPEAAKRDTLRPLADEIIYDVLRGGELDSVKLNRLFDTAWDAGREADTEYYEQYKDVRDKIRTQAIAILEKDRADIADFGQFRRQTMGTLRIAKDGLPVDTFYQEMRDMAPELFPASITAPSDQLLKLYEVASSIKKSERTLNEAFGAQADSFRTWARNDFDESVQRMAEGIRIAKRYQQALDDKKKKLAIPQTAEEAMQLAKDVKAEKKRFQKVQNKYLLTDNDQRIVNMLLRGDTTPEAVRGRENADAILKTYEAKADYDMLALRLRAWNENRKETLRKLAENALNAAEAEKWVDKATGLQYMRETMERNIRDIARAGKVSDEQANRFNDEYFTPVHKNESERKNYVVGLQDKIRALNISRKIENGNLVSESYAVQWLGEAEFNRDYLQQHPRAAKRGGFSLEEWNTMLQKFHEENPRLDYAKIENAVKVFHSVYDQLYEDMNRVRMENGYEPVDYLQGYFPHFQEHSEDGSLLAKFGRQIGITDDVTPLPTTINGLTHTFKPGIRYMANIQQRLGYATAYDALQGFDRYVETASDVIWHTADIQRLRALATQIRYRASDEGVKKQIDRILQDKTLTPDEANDRVAQLTKDAPFALSNFVAELDEYTNLLAGKKSRLDRGMEKMLGRRFYNIAKAFESRVGANMVAANIGSALTNFIPITQAWSQVSTADILKGMWQTLQNYKSADGLDAMSTFINNRSGYERLAMTGMDRVSKAAGFLMEAVDGFTTGSVVRARYLQNLRLGMSAENAMQEADQFAAGIMADRSKGSTPTLYQSRNPLVKLMTQFQLEVNNELSWIFKDMIPAERKKGLAALAAALLKFLIGSWLYNEAYEALVGRRAALDPLDILNDTVGDFTGYQLPNTVRSALSGEWDFTKEKPGTYQAIKNLEGNLISELPGTQALTMLGLDEAWGLEIDSGRIAVSSAIPNIGKIEKALMASSEDMAPKKKAETVVNELMNPAAYLALPFGGGQVKKMVQGAQAVARGGSYKTDNEGRDQLQYPVYNETAGDTARNLAQALLFGKTATEEAQGWVESGFKSLSAKETAAYQAMIQTDAGQRESYTFVTAMKNVKEKEAKLSMLFAYDLPESGKAAYYYEALAEDSERERMDALREKGISKEEYVAFKQAYFAEYGTQAVSQERMNTVLDKLNLPKNKKAEIWRSCGKDWKEENNPYK